MKRKFWYFMHNAIAHPLLIFSFNWADKFHDYTHNKMAEGEVQYKDPMVVIEGWIDRYKHEANNSQDIERSVLCFKIVSVLNGVKNDMGGIVEASELPNT